MIALVKFASGNGKLFKDALKPLPKMLLTNASKICKKQTENSSAEIHLLLISICVGGGGGGGGGATIAAASTSIIQSSLLAYKYDRLQTWALSTTTEVVPDCEGGGGGGGGGGLFIGSSGTPVALDGVVEASQAFFDKKTECNRWNVTERERNLRSVFDSVKGYTVGRFPQN
uniref:Uncharacterized protein n=1 Tax=Romanomermis culicivorax TaxID=13658 RepID=A0A915L6I3_ROMCU